MVGAFAFCVVLLNASCCACGFSCRRECVRSSVVQSVVQFNGECARGRQLQCVSGYGSAASVVRSGEGQHECVGLVSGVCVEQMFVCVWTWVIVVGAME